MIWNHYYKHPDHKDNADFKLAAAMLPEMRGKPTRDTQNKFITHVNDWAKKLQPGWFYMRANPDGYERLLRRGPDGQPELDKNGKPIYSNTWRDKKPR